MTPPIGDLGLTYIVDQEGNRTLTLPDDARSRVMTFIQETSVKSPADIAAAVQEGQDSILDGLRDLTDAQSGWKPSDEDWSVLEVMAHVVTIKRIMPALVTSLAKGELPPGFGPEFEEARFQDGLTNASFATIADAREAAEAAHRDMLNVISDLDGADSEVRFRHFVFGAMNAREWACFYRIHDADHGPYLRRLRALPGFPAR